MKRTRRQASGGSAPLPSGFHLACPLLTLVFILSYILLHSIFFSSLYLSLPMALANTSQGLQTTLGDDHSDSLWNCTNEPTHHGGTETGTTPASSFGRDAARCLVREPQGRAPRLPAPRNPDPSLMESHPAFSCSLRSSFLFNDLSYRSVVYYPLISA